jgi:hypothetical protein
MRSIWRAGGKSVLLTAEIVREDGTLVTVELHGVASGPTVTTMKREHLAIGRSRV